jgi:hypothetical protein
MRQWRKERREFVLTPETIQAGAEVLDLATAPNRLWPTASSQEIATQVFMAMLGPRAKQRKIT